MPAFLLSLLRDGELFVVFTAAPVSLKLIVSFVIIVCSFAWFLGDLGENLGPLGDSYLPTLLGLLGLLPPVSAVTPLQAEQFALGLQLYPNRQ